MTEQGGASETYVALLRGINVGGKNIIRMADLRSCFEAEGFRDVLTYIQSGNVIFRAPDSTPRALTIRIEEMLASAFDYQARVMLRSRRQMEAVVAGAPAGFGSQPDRHRYDVIFLRDTLTAEDAMGEVLVRPGVDEAWTGEGVLYFSRLISQASRSYLSRLVSMPVYQEMTIRNWNTTTRLLQLMS
ncbi:MAG: DUF1697 domain-containing protein [Acidobacteria bacterium]|nr:DUF1697 domain-containing protein [Gemmatimonadota bacterium]MYF14800.1 DUF1697 domain-containing protein [Acidobacteriota bacterium]MYJ69058.1 DUF1697 domain-containing protein [Gemmatimonadota bacterium]